MASSLTKDSAPTGIPGSERSFFGHPRGLATLFMTEMWERFSYYGMRALLPLYLVAPAGLGLSATTATAIYSVYLSLVYLLALELVTVPIFAFFFLGSAAALPPLLAVLLLADLGLAATGTLISSMAVNSRARDLLVPLVLLPLVVPLMIAATGATDPLLAAGGPAYDRFGTWLGVLGLYDLIFVLVGYAVFDFLLED